MEKVNKLQETEDRIIMIRDLPVLIDRDVAELYGVTTKVVNQAEKRNEDKFPESYRFPLQPPDIQELVTNCDRFKTLKHSTSRTYAFTEKGLYMLATVLRSPMATEVTFAIIETFTKVRELSRAIAHANLTGIEPSNEVQKGIQERLADVLNDNLPLKVQKITMGLNLGFVKFEVEMSWDKEKAAKHQEISQNTHKPY